MRPSRSHTLSFFAVSLTLALVSPVSAGADRMPVDPSAVTAPGGLAELDALAEAGEGGAPDLVPGTPDGERALLDLGDLGEVGNAAQLGRARGLGTGAPDRNDPTREYLLPAWGLLPENIAFEKKTGRYFVSAFGTGAVLRGSLDADTAEVFLPPLTPARPSGIGIDVDDRGRLYVLSTLTGLLQVFDSDSGEELSTFETGLGGAVNDVKVAPNGDVFVTDSLRPVLFRIPAQAVGAGQGRVQRIELGPELQTTLAPQLNGVFNANGVVIVDDRTLIVGQTNVDKLYAVHLTGGTDARVEEIDLDGELQNPDGLELAGNTLFAVDNLNNEVVGIELSRNLRRGKIVSRTSDDTFASITGIASTGNRLLLTNSQIFTVPMVLPFTVSSIARPRP